MNTALLDVNVLLALLDSDHVDHSTAREWFRSDAVSGWASCALTQNGFIRIISQPRYPSPVAPAQAIARLAQATATALHQFLHSTVSILDSAWIDASKVLSPKQVTDVYLLALARAHGMRLATFDRAITWTAVKGASSADLTVLT